MQNEQQEYLKKLRSKAFADHSRYTGCHEQAAEQIEVAPFLPVTLQALLASSRVHSALAKVFAMKAW